jgi:hypothetical protein
MIAWLADGQEVFQPEHFQEVHEKGGGIPKDELQLAGSILMQTAVPPQPSDFLAEEAGGLSWPAYCTYYLL